MSLAEPEASPPGAVSPAIGPKPSLHAAPNLRRLRTPARGFTRAAPSTAAALPDPHLLTAIFEGLRNQTRALTVPLSVEDQCVQSMPDASPTKWHLAHTTWFFETFILSRHYPAYQPFDASFRQLFNSYYETVGPRYPRARRGLLTRPTCADVNRYRAHVDEHMAAFMSGGKRTVSWEQAAPLVMLGCHHEQQHQELILTDIRHAFSAHPAFPAYMARPTQHGARETMPLRWINFPGGDYEVGHRGAGFAFDNEGPHHVVKLRPFAIGSRAVTNAEWLAFMADGGYARPELWLSDGWDTVQRQAWHAPEYWIPNGSGSWHRFTLAGLIPLDPAAPVCHVSFYEADAYARWVGKRLPTEAEWEIAAASQAPQMMPHTDISSANLLETGVLEPQPPAWGDGFGAQQLFGDVWEWTQSPYAPYPGYKASSDAVGEYNGKFMINQIVLGGGSCVTPASHIRATYRNFFYPHMRWQYAGLRLAAPL